jgi:2,4-dienoyl-CoA reductase-like NADH-dependent reductase (Old Yellow Enzyme family)
MLLALAWWAHTNFSKYGGSLENRARFILEVVNAVKEKLPSDKFVIAAKLNCQDCMFTEIEIVKTPC